MKTDDVVFRKDLYPRFEHSVPVVRQYAADLEVLPPIEVNQHNELIDGRHRWLAFKINKEEEIPAIVTETKSEAHLLELAIERNNAHGLQLSASDKKDMACKIYAHTSGEDKKGKKEELAKLLSVSDRTVADWLSRIDKDTKNARNKRIATLWQACYTDTEVAEMEGIPRQTVNDIFKSNAGKCSSANFGITPENFEDRIGRPPPLYNVWKTQEKNNEGGHFGNSEASFIENLLYMYTEPGHIVVDPFAAGGSTRDACKRFGCRYWLGDRMPIVGEEDRIDGIRTYDVVVDGLPDLRGRWGDVDLVYLDPPHWEHTSMTADAFHVAMAKIVNGFMVKLSAGGKVAMVMKPSLWRAEVQAYTPHLFVICKKVKSAIAMRIQAPYDPQTCTDQMVEWAKENRELLELSREIVVWSKQ